MPSQKNGVNGAIVTARVISTPCRVDRAAVVSADTSVAPPSASSASSSASSSPAPPAAPGTPLRRPRLYRTYTLVRALM